MVGWLCVVESRQKIYEYDMKRQIRTKIIGSRGCLGGGLFWRIALTAYLYSHHLTIISFTSLDRTTILHGLYKQHIQQNI